MNSKVILEVINKKQLETIECFETFKKSSKLNTKQRGLYWIWTSLSDEDLLNAKWSEKQKHVNIPFLINQRKKLEHLCQLSGGKFRVIYNGIGGYNNLSINSSGLRERILQEFNATSVGTGTLSLISTALDMSYFAISYFNFDDVNNKELLNFLENDDAYLKYALDLEKLWRLEFGYPILCRT